MQKILREEGPRFVQTVWQEGARQPASGPGDDAGEEQAPRRGLLNVLPSFRGDAERREEPRLSNEDDELSAEPDVSGPSLTIDQVRKLEGVMAELHECRRLADAAYAEDA